MTIVLISLLFLFIAAVLAAVLLSDALLQRLATALCGAPLEPRPLLTVRKVGYIVLIVYLFTWTLAWRRYVVDAAAAQLAVREQSRGDVHLTGSLVRLGLGGFRGVTTCYLWNLAMDKQKKNQLNELEVIVGWLTELQPHFNTPWLFQSWNLAYNVSNKTDRISDKYFYITRGVRLLADGERQNHDDPDLRFELGATYQHKICQSDETNVHRSLFQLSLIPPNERDPARFRARPGSGQRIDLKEFRAFAEKHPQLVRRLREGIHKDTASEQRYEFTCSTPEAVVQFLADNYRVPSLYPEARPTPPGEKWADNPNEKPDPDPLERFPVLPPHAGLPVAFDAAPFEPYDGLRERDDDQSPYTEDLDSWDGYVAARAWYSYSQEPIPDCRRAAGFRERHHRPGPPAQAAAHDDADLPPLPGADAELRRRAPGGGGLVRRRGLVAQGAGVVLPRRPGRHRPQLGAGRLGRGLQDVGRARPPQPPDPVARRRTTSPGIGRQILEGQAGAQGEAAGDRDFAGRGDPGGMESLPLHGRLRLLPSRQQLRQSL